MEEANKTIMFLFVIKRDKVYLICFALFLMNFCLLTLSFTKLKLLLLVCFAVMSILTAGYCFARNALVRVAFSLNITIFILIYLLWIFISVLYGNDILFIFQDSVGFPLYLSYIPLAFILIKFGSELFYERLLITIGMVVSCLHIIVYLLFYVFLGTDPLTKVYMDYINELILQSGFTAQFGSSQGIVRVNFRLGQLLLIPLMLLVRDLIKADGWRSSKTQLVLLLVILVGIILDGNRALLITAMLALAFLLAASVKYLKLKRTSYSRLMYGMLLVAPAIFFLFWMLSLFDMFNLSNYGERIGALVSSEKGIAIGDEVRRAQIGPLVEKFLERPMLGSGFGSYAKLLRNIERPFMYELDYLAVAMKLGLIGTVLYLGTYLTVLLTGIKVLRSCYYEVFPYVLTGVAYLFFMGTNGGFAMSPASTLFHIMVMLGIAKAIHTRKSLHYRYLHR